MRPRCEHLWVEVLNRRWCVRPYDEGGCGAFQRRRSISSPWMPSGVMGEDSGMRGTLLMVGACAWIGAVGTLWVVLTGF